MMKSNKKRNLAIVLTGLLCIVMFSCARERGRTDIALEMTDEDSVEAIIDQDLLAGCPGVFAYYCGGYKKLGALFLKLEHLFQPFIFLNDILAVGKFV